MHEQTKARNQHHHQHLAWPCPLPACISHGSPRVLWTKITQNNFRAPRPLHFRVPLLHKAVEEVTTM
ncbi:hypothetical protein E2C01_089066 [Portunus trituberculatus]|uniref:Uncharacterized protein n=1 Tax=Portunus trituberculatus TaxID=210409 RepID=A0A5B7JGA0_PORTR|nr:hypothetical protein [Portunus trituberculatus]